MSNWVERREALGPECRKAVGQTLKLRTIALLPYRRRIVTALARQLADARSKSGDDYWGGVGDDVLKGYTACFNACEDPVEALLPPAALEALIERIDQTGREFAREEEDQDGFGFATIAEFGRDLMAMRSSLGRLACKAEAWLRGKPPEPQEIETEGWYLLKFQRGLRQVRVLAPLKVGGAFDYARLNAEAFEAARIGVRGRAFAVTPMGHHTFVLGTLDGNLRLPHNIVLGRSRAASGKPVGKPLSLVEAVYIGG